jgi:cell division septation protein DedD
MRPLIYYTLWQILTRNPGISGADAAGTDNAESWKSRLFTEFPQSPEARAARAEYQKNSPVISAVQSPLWLLFPATAGLPSAGTAKPAAPAPVAPAASPSTVSAPAASTPAPAVSAAPSVAASTPTVSAPAPAAAVSAPSAAASQAVSAVVLQTGLFSKEANARAQSEALRKAGFTASLTRKLVNGAEYWAVTVPPGQDQRKPTADLKKAGFDSFPVK